MESCSLWMILTGSGSEVPESEPLSSIFTPSDMGGVSMEPETERLLPNTARMKIS